MTISVIKGSDNVNYNLRDDVHTWGGRNLFKGLYTGTATYSGGLVASGGLTLTIPLANMVGKNFVFSFDYSVEGAKFDTSSDYSKNRFGMHLTLNYTPSGGSATTTYPCAGYLNMSGTGRAIQYFSVPNNCTVNSFSAAIQLYNKPASGNSNTWYIKNVKLEIGNKATDWSPAPEDIARINGECLELLS